jgi:hypothetical protein
LCSSRWEKQKRVRKRKKEEQSFFDPPFRFVRSRFALCCVFFVVFFVHFFATKEGVFFERLILSVK